jgi:hypothetical protein
MFDPSCVSKHVFDAAENRSICSGAEFSCGAKSCHPGVLSFAVVVLCAWTERMLT